MTPYDKEWVAATKEEITTAWKMIQRDGYDAILNQCEDYSTFIKTAPDMERFVCSEECFYSLKIGFSIAEVPSKLIYTLQSIYKETHCCNVILQCLRKSELEKVLTVGYLKDGWTIGDVIKVFVDRSFVPLTESEPFYFNAYGVEWLDTSTGDIYFIPKRVADKFPPKHYQMVEGKFYLNAFTAGDGYLDEFTS